MSLVASQSIRRHQANSSTSKTAYKFPMTQRFKQPNPECKNSFYQQKLTELSKRQTSFGYGTKSDFTLDTAQTPAPTNYQLKTTFQASRQKGKSFGLSRETSPDRMYTIPQMQKVPGPGQYDHKNSVSKSPPKYSMRTKPRDFIAQKLTFKQVPGPGSYEALNMDPSTGRFKVSKFGDCKFAKIDPNAPRFGLTRSSTLAFAYQHKDSISPQGKYIQAKNRGDGTRAFSRTKRQTFIDQRSKSVKVLPGPGAYDKPSDFGVYGTYGDNLWATKRK